MIFKLGLYIWYHLGEFQHLKSKMNEKKMHVYFKCLNWQKNTINVNYW